MKRIVLFFVMAIMAAGLMGCTTVDSVGDNDVSNYDSSQNHKEEVQENGQQKTSNLASKNIHNVESGANANADAGDDSNANSDPGANTNYPITITDITGKEFTFTKAPERIVSTSPSETEILFALGLGDKIVGVSEFDNYPEEAKQKPKVGDLVKPNEEAMIGAEPDLVIVGGAMSNVVVKKLRGLQLNVFKQEPKNLDGILNEILTLGKITDTANQAEALVAQMRADIRKVADAAAKLKPEEKKRVYLEYSPGWTVGKGEFMDELITLAGGINIASDLEGWNAINEEKIVRDNPAVILYTLNIKDEKTGKSLDQLIKTRSGWSKIKAIHENRLVGLDGDILSRPGPRITQALLQISEAIYPGLVSP